jgi:hypothetical protein
VLADRLGIWASGLCFVHCLLAPIVISFSAVTAHLLPSEEKTHRFLAIVVTLLACAAILNGFRKHRRRPVLLCAVCGLVCIGGTAWWGDRLPSHAFEVLITLAGSVLMIAAHRMNHTFCQNCRCAE